MLKFSGQTAKEISANTIDENSTLSIGTSDFAAEKLRTYKFFHGFLLFFRRRSFFVLESYT